MMAGKIMFIFLHGKQKLSCICLCDIFILAEIERPAQTEEPMRKQDDEMLMEPLPVGKEAESNMTAPSRFLWKKESRNRINNGSNKSPEQ